MFGKISRLTPLESRKQLLIVESEINRAHMADDLATLNAQACEFADRAKTIGSIATSAASLVSGLTSFRRDKPSATEAKPTWVQSVLKGAGMVSSLWTALRASKAENQPPHPRP